MDSSDPVDALALRFYEAAADPELFAPLIRDISSYIGCTGGSFLVWDNINSGFLFNGFDGADPETARRYDQYYGSIDPRHALMGTQPASKIVRCHEHFDESFVSRNEVYADFHIPLGARYMAMTRLTPDREVSAYLNLARTVEMGPFDDAACAVIARLIPHALRAAKLGQRMAQLQYASDRAEVALDRVDWGIVIINADGRVLTTNAAARTLLCRVDGLSLARGRLVTGTTRDQARLDALIEGTALAERAGAGGAGGALAIERPSGRRPLNLLAVPLPRTLAETFYARSGSIMITMTDPERAPVTPASAMTSLYGLSAREAQIAIALAAGLSIAQIAETHQRSQETIRGQVKAVLFKTGSGRQSDLVRIVLSLPRLYDGAQP